MVLEIYLMIKLEGIVLNVFTQQGGKDKKTGDQFADRDKVQILGAMDLPNGDVKNELFTLSVENYRDFSDFLNQKFLLLLGQWQAVVMWFLCRKRRTAWISKNRVKHEKTVS